MWENIRARSTVKISVWYFPVMNALSVNKKLINLPFLFYMYKRVESRCRRKILLPCHDQKSFRKWRVNSCIMVDLSRCVELHVSIFLRIYFTFYSTISTCMVLSWSTFVGLACMHVHVYTVLETQSGIITVNKFQNGSGLNYVLG